MFGGADPQMERASELYTPVPKGQPYSVALPGTATEGRSAIYRHWKFADKPLLEKLVPEVNLHSFFSLTEKLSTFCKSND